MRRALEPGSLESILLLSSEFSQAQSLSMLGKVVLVLRHFVALFLWSSLLAVRVSPTCSLNSGLSAAQKTALVRGVRSQVLDVLLLSLLFLPHDPAAASRLALSSYSGANGINRTQSETGDSKLNVVCTKFLDGEKKSLITPYVRGKALDFPFDSLSLSLYIY